MAVGDAPLGQPQIYKIGSRRFAFGLLWQAAESPKTVLREARALASDPRVKADLYVVRTGAECQFGLGRKASGLVPGAVAAAAAAASRLKGTWLGAFRLGAGYWIVAIRDDLVLPDGDRYYATESDARERFLAEHRQGGWQRVFGPTAWLDTAEEVSAADLLGNAKQPRLAEVNPLAARFKYILAAGLGFGVLLGAAWYYQHVATTMPVPPDINYGALPPPPAPPAATPPWYERANAGMHFDACVARLATLPTDAPGYRLRSLSCDHARYSAKFARAGGVAAWFEAWAKSLDETFVVNIAPAGDAAELAGALTPLPPRGIEGIYTADAISRAFVEAAQTLQDELKIGQVRLPPVPAGNAPAAAPRPAFAPMAFTITTPNIGAWKTYIASVPGVVVSVIDFDATTTKWKIQGDIYVRL